MKIINTFKSKLGSSKAKILIAFSVVLFGGCVQEIDLFTGKTSPLIVSGHVSNEPGPQSVKLYYSEGYNSRPNYNVVSDARVAILDDQGNEEVLDYTSYGVFLTSDDFTGVVGKSYKLTIELETGEKYESGFEPLKAAPEVSEVTYTLTDNGNIIFNATYTDNAETEDYYRWRFEGTFQIQAPDYDDGGSWSSKFGFCYPGIEPKTRFEYCWVTDLDNGFLNLSSDEFTNGQTVDDFPVYGIELTKAFDIGYSGQVKLESLSKEAYNYWSAVKAQLGNTGSIFETANYQIRGNIKDLSDPDVQVIGYFDASAVSSARAYVDEFQNTFPPLTCEENLNGCKPVNCITCIKYSANTTRFKPEYWPR
ncbi:MAG: DUF4249 domain-containing protein [Cyclobacteriaceae bacterium]